MHIEILNLSQEKKYEELLLSRNDTLLYASLKYRDFLCKILENATPTYLIAVDNDRVIGALPAFVKNSSKYGCVLNSLPFYGSNGGVIIAPDLSEPHSVQQALIKAFNDLADEYDVKSSTIIINPFDTNLEIYGAKSNHTHLDQRMGNITHLPVTENEGIETTLMSQFHQKTRNMVRKGIKSGFSTINSAEEKVLDWLHKTHTDNMHAIGGFAKPQSVFHAIRDTFIYGKDYKIYIAHNKNNEFVAGLLVFYYNKTVEYFTPVVVKEYRDSQILSAIIFTAMLDSVRDRYLYWNWGGTWRSQTSVYHFKKRWGSVDLPYYYYTRVRDANFLDVPMSELLLNFQYFYLFPFGGNA